MQSFIQQCRQVGCNGNIHLLFNQKDVKDNQIILQEIRPDRLIVGQIYVVLKHCDATVTDCEIVTKAWEKYQVFISEASVSAAIKILEELKLIHCELVGIRRKIAILSVPKEKLEIEQSKTFRQGALQKDEFETYAERIMNLSSNELLQLLRGKEHSV